MRVGPRALVTVLAVAALAVGCGDDDGPADDGIGPPSAPTPPTAPPAPSVSPPGTGTVVVGGATSTFTLSECRTEPVEADEAVQRLLVVTGAGVTEGGIEFTVEVMRFATGTDVRTFTDAITYTDPARILQAQRIEVAGEVTDLRDDDARSPLLTIRPGGVAGRGLAGPPGSTAADDGITGIALDATC